MARITKYKKGNKTVWRVKYIEGIDIKTGKYIDRTKSGFETEREAKIFANKVELQKYSGNKIINKERKVLFGDFIEEWLVEYEHSGIKTSTLVNRKTTSVPHIKRFLGKFNLQDIDAGKISEMVAQLEKDGYSKATIDMVYTATRLIMKKALEKGYIRELPIITRQRKKKTLDDLVNEKNHDEFLEKDELNKLLSLIKSTNDKHKESNDHAMFTTLAYTGMRIGEVLALKWEDIDFENKTIKVWKTLFREKNTIEMFELTPPKTESSVRDIPLSNAVSDALLDLHARVIELRKNKLLVIDEDFIFIKMTGNHCGYPELQRTVLYRLKEYVRKSKIPKSITVHKFRHTFTSLMAEAGVDLHTIQQLLGHESSKVTQKIYLHITNNLKSDAITKFDTLMKN